MKRKNGNRLRAARLLLYGCATGIACGGVISLFFGVLLSVEGVCTDSDEARARVMVTVRGVYTRLRSVVCCDCGAVLGNAIVGTSSSTLPERFPRDFLDASAPISGAGQSSGTVITASSTS